LAFSIAPRQSSSTKRISEAHAAWALAAGAGAALGTGATAGAAAGAVGAGAAVAHPASSASAKGGNVAAKARRAVEREDGVVS
jgi:hypothetical protein